MLFEDFDADGGKFDLQDIDTFRDPSEMFVVGSKRTELVDDIDAGQPGGVVCQHATPGSRRRVDPTTLITISLCDFCPHESPDTASLARHVASQHGRELKRFDCRACGKEFDDYAETETTAEEALLRPAGKHPCPLCDETFHRKGEVTKHLLSHGPFDCEQCGRSFKVRSYLIRHMVAMHSVPSSKNPELTAHCLDGVEEMGRPAA